MAQLDRRKFLMTAAAAGAAGVSVVVDPVRFAYAAGGDQTRTLSGLVPYGAPDWVYIPVEVPDGVNRISVTYSYDRPTPPPGQAGNALDIGLFDQRGYDLGNAAGFRGWSGGFRNSFTISASEATPGYLPGPIGKGTWHLIVGPYTVAPQGLNWSVTITLGFGPAGPAFVPRPAPHRAATQRRTRRRSGPRLDPRRGTGRTAVDRRVSGGQPVFHRLGRRRQWWPGGSRRAPVR